MKKILRRTILVALILFFIVLAFNTASAAETPNENPALQDQSVNQSSSTNLTGNTELANVTISGEVKKCSNGDPFAGVTVTVEKNGAVLASTTTKADGTYNLNFQSNGRTFKVTASYSGHVSSTQEVTVSPNTDPSDPNLYGFADFKLGLETVYVSPTGSDITGDGSQNNPFQTIQKGINEANPGGTVYVAAGTYTENISINKPLTLRGAKWGVDARTRDVTTGESIIESPNTYYLLVSINADNVTIDGFTVRGNPFGPGIYNLVSGNTTILNNYITDNCYGMDLGGDDLLVRFNRIQANNRTPSGYQGDGLVIDRDNSRATIQYNLFEDNMSHSILTTAPNTKTHYNINISYNTIVNAGLTAIQLAGRVANTTISDNTIINAHARMNPAYSNRGAIHLHQSSSLSGPVSIFENFIDSRFWGISFAGYLNGNTVTIHFNNLVHEDTGGILNNATDSGSVNVTLNWWGLNLSPAEKIHGSVIFDPWIVLSIAANPTTIFNGNTSTVTADLLRDSGGIYHDPAFGHVPDGIPITLTIDWGSFINPGITHFVTLNTVNGGVTATLFANEVPTPVSPLNPVKVTATADGYTTNDAESAYITINTQSQPSNGNSGNIVEAANKISKTIRMQETGLPLAGLVLAVLAIFSGLVMPKRK